MPTKVELIPALPGLSPVGGKPVIARFGDGQLSSDGGLLVLRVVEQCLDVAARFAACIDPAAGRQPLLRPRGSKLVLGEQG